MSVIKNFFQNASLKAKALVITGISGFLLIIIIFIISLFFSNSPQPSHINITNFQEVTGSSYDKQVATGNEIWSSLIANDEAKTIDQSKYYTAVIRDNSFSSQNINGINTQMFIVDIEELRQSAKITFYPDQTSTNTPPIRATCVFPDNVIYPETKCLVVNPLSRLRSYLPYSTYLPDQITPVEASVGIYSEYREHSSESYLAITVNACSNQDLLRQGEYTIRQWLKSLYLDPNDYYIEVLDACK